jgi:hypothetical protein
MYVESYGAKKAIHANIRTMADLTRGPLSMQKHHHQAIIVMHVPSVWQQHTNLQALV